MELRYSLCTSMVKKLGDFALSFATIIKLLTWKLKIFPLIVFNIVMNI